MQEHLKSNWKAPEYIGKTPRPVLKRTLKSETESDTPAGKKTELLAVFWDTVTSLQLVDYQGNQAGF